MAVPGKASEQILEWTCVYGHDEMDMSLCPDGQTNMCKSRFRAGGKGRRTERRRSLAVRPLHEHVSHTWGRVGCP